MRLIECPMADVLNEVDALAGPESLPAVRDGTAPDSLCTMLAGLMRLALAVATVLVLVAGAAELGLRAAGAKSGGSAAVANVLSRPGDGGWEAPSLGFLFAAGSWFSSAGSVCPWLPPAEQARPVGAAGRGSAPARCGPWPESRSLS